MSIQEEFFDVAEGRDERYHKRLTSVLPAAGPQAQVKRRTEQTVS